ncbi:MAG: glycosyltransferase family 2 protein [Wujia sp.]
MNKNNIIISVIIPAYNCEGYIGDAIDSVLNQTFKNYEVIIIDDGSSDSTGELLDRYAKEYNCIRVLHIPNGGVSNARNIGINEAVGKWIYFMDSDDTISNKMLEELYLNVTEKDADVVISGVIINRIHCGKVSKEDTHLSSDLLNGKKQIADYLRKMNNDDKGIFLDFIWNRLIKADIIRNNFLKFEENIRLGEDFIFNCNVLKNSNKIVIINKSYYNYMCRGDNSLVNSFNDNEYERRMLISKVYSDLFSFYDILQDNEVQNKLMYNDGKCSLISLTKLTKSNCQLSKKEKMEYINKFVCGDLRESILYFLKSEKSIKNIIKYFLVRFKLSGILYLIICKH